MKIGIALAALLLATTVAKAAVTFKVYDYGGCEVSIAKKGAGQVTVTWRFDSPDPDFPIGIVSSDKGPDSEDRKFSVLQELAPHKGEAIFPAASKAWVGIAFTADPKGPVIPVCEKQVP
jgi:hypothetical protein